MSLPGRADRSRGTRLGPGAWRLRLTVALLVTVLSCGGTGYLKTEPDAPFVPTPYAAVFEMLRMAAVTEHDTVYDLGCGDGRVVIAAAANLHARGVGVDLDPVLLSLSRANAQKAGVADRVTFLRQDIFQTNIKDATVVALYLLPGLNTLLIPKLRTELAPGSRVVSHMHDMGEWPPDRVSRVGDSTIYLWVVPADVDGTWEMKVTDGKRETAGELWIRQNYHGFQPRLVLGGRKVGAFDPALNGPSILFSTRYRQGAQEETARYRGLVLGDRMEGEVTVTGGAAPGTYRWTAERKGGR